MRDGEKARTLEGETVENGKQIVYNSPRLNSARRRVDIPVYPWHKNCMLAFRPKGGDKT